MAPSDSDVAFLDWFKANGGSFSDKTVIKHTENMGRALFAVDDIADDEILFSIPRALVLSTRTSPLGKLLNSEEWQPLEKTWAGLILCVMYEMAKDLDSHWAPYLATFPQTFDTLMFWTDSELAELKGSLVLEKIGKTQAEQEYTEVILPLVSKRPEVFGPAQPYDLLAFHKAGSAILSRSFTVLSEVENSTKEASSQSGDMSDSEDEEEDASTVAMVPFADILNAKSDCNNARLFYEDADFLVMKTTQPIDKGEQIFNTYAEPPNSDLLRRYGHVDEPNSNDVVEIEADLVADVVCKAVVGVNDLRSDKVEWMLNNGMDDCFSITKDDVLPEELVSCVLLFAASSKGYAKIVDSKEPPRPQFDQATCVLLKKTVQARLAQYPTTLEEDQSLLESLSGDSRLRKAIVVRKGEKELLQATLEHVDSLKKEAKGTKRKAASGESTSKRQKA